MSGVAQGNQFEKSVSKGRLAGLEAQVIEAFFALARQQGKKVVCETDLDRYLDLKHSGRVFDPQGDYVVFVDERNAIIDITPVVYHTIGQGVSNEYVGEVFASMRPKGLMVVLSDAHLDLMNRFGQGYLLGRVGNSEFVADEVIESSSKNALFCVEDLAGVVARVLPDGQAAVPFARSDDVSQLHGEAYTLFKAARNSSVDKFPAYGVLVPDVRFYAVVPNSAGAHVTELPFRLHGARRK
ncbi:hypothetical protein C4580_04225 [Candidatus Woesearchaeota archaeon]|nr:MAG: hypothetical protein C4580_04225 [Candidatus Woesearchaeota archaeon]